MIRERFVGLCVQSTTCPPDEAKVRDADAKVLNVFTAKLKSLRWEVVVEFISEVSRRNGSFSS